MKHNGCIKCLFKDGGVSRTDSNGHKSPCRAVQYAVKYCKQRNETTYYIIYTIIIYPKFVKHYPGGYETQGNNYQLSKVQIDCIFEYAFVAFFHLSQIFRYRKHIQISSSATLK